jgi:hypothetical protein
MLLTTVDQFFTPLQAGLLRRNLHATYEMLEWLLFDYELSWCAFIVSLQRFYYCTTYYKFEIRWS